MMGQALIAQPVLWKTLEQEVAGLNLLLAQHSFQGLIIVSMTGFIFLSPLSIVIWESSQWLGKNFVQSTF